MNRLMRWAAWPLVALLCATCSPAFAIQQQDNPLAVAAVQQALSASGLVPVSAAIVSASASPNFSPLAGRLFHVQFSGTGVATCYLERQLDGSTWVPITVTAGGTTTTLYNWSYTGSRLSEDVSESQTAVPYRVDCGASLGSYTSGTITVKISQ